MAKVRIAMGRVGAMTVLWLACFAAPGAAAAAELRDGTPIPVRLAGIINSETTRSGEPLTFVVAQNVVSSRGEILIPKGTLVAGAVTKSRRARWGFKNREPKLTFTFSLTTARNGRMIALRASATGRKGDAIAVSRYERHHQLRWASGADVFEAYVDGTYEI